MRTMLMLGNAECKEKMGGLVFFFKNIKYDTTYVKTVTEIQQTYQGFEIVVQ